MILTDDQNKGLAIALERYKHNEKYVTICGYAGTGKSTLVRFIIEALNVDEDKVAYACYTGKAAEVLRKKGNKNAMTLHRLLYDSIPRPGGGFIRKPKPLLDYTVIVADECSMIPKTMVDMLLSHKVFVIFLGDNFQLPQIDKNESHDLLEHPHVFLSEVMRQAAESEIIQLTMKIRNGETIDTFHGNEVQVLEKGSLNTGMLTWADQIICATNASRISLNNQMRNLLGYHGTPQNGERMICLRNYWEDLSDDGNSALVNGTTGIIQNPFETYRMAPGYVKMRSHKMDEICGGFITDDGHTFNSVEMDRKMIETGEPCLDWRESYALGRLRNKIGDIAPRHFSFGYAITAHKAQGSEWDKVLVVEEQFPFDKKEHARWFYTAATRAAEKLVLIRG